MEPEKEILKSYEQMAIIEKYEEVIKYLYPIAQNIKRRHGVAKSMFIACLLGQVNLFTEAGKTDQVSRLHLADAGLSDLRFWLRFLSSDRVKGITFDQEQRAQILIAPVGKMLGTWISKQRRRGHHG